jgi:hypothetical protein
MKDKKLMGRAKGAILLEMDFIYNPVISVAFGSFCNDYSYCSQSTGIKDNTICNGEGNNWMNQLI